MNIYAKKILVVAISFLCASPVFSSGDVPKDIEQKESSISRLEASRNQTKNLGVIDVRASQKCVSVDGRPVGNNCEQVTDDLCLNIEGRQTVILPGRHRVEDGSSPYYGWCLVNQENIIKHIQVADICTNYEGIQYALPRNHFSIGKECFRDACLNIDGNQKEVPDLAAVIRIFGFDPSVEWTRTVNYFEWLLQGNCSSGLGFFGGFGGWGHSGSSNCFKEYTEWSNNRAASGDMKDASPDEVMVDGIDVHYGVCVNAKRYGDFWATNPNPDLCPNIDGVQDIIPAGRLTNRYGECAQDLCLNLTGLQETVPPYYVHDKVDNVCIYTPPEPSYHDGDSGGGDYSDYSGGDSGGGNYSDYSGGGGGGGSSPPSSGGGSSDSSYSSYVGP